MNQKEAQKFLHKFVSQLAEHFDCVQILVSSVEPDGGTVSHFNGSGNWYARRAMCQEFIETDQAKTMAQITKEVDGEDEDFCNPS
jgi:hypothetical protein